ncbi:hypothetical protein [Usitatibacter palustris]|uniref:hypothetical protein n=1 Tax=Usitatibacter palustris TaxID=2732487 RepID=UPI0014881B15|nr:hypothetical protein [Usitatibacter palustris]
MPAEPDGRVPLKNAIAAVVAAAAFLIIGMVSFQRLSAGIFMIGGPRTMTYAEAVGTQGERPRWLKLTGLNLTCAQVLPFYVPRKDGLSDPFYFVSGSGQGRSGTIIVVGDGDAPPPAQCAAATSSHVGIFGPVPEWVREGKSKTGKSLRDVPDLPMLYLGAEPEWAKLAGLAALLAFLLVAAIVAVIPRKAPQAQQ